MKATYDPAAKTKYTPSHRKEGKCYFEQYSIIQLPAKGDTHQQVREPVCLRIYGTGSSNTACLWINTPDVHTSGSGSAGGYGYHRPSAAAATAIRNAGFALDEDIAERGEGPPL